MQVPQARHQVLWRLQHAGVAWRDQIVPEESALSGPEVIKR
jgi:hypothetical protein